MPFCYLDITSPHDLFSSGGLIMEFLVEKQENVIVHQLRMSALWQIDG